MSDETGPDRVALSRRAVLGGVAAGIAGSTTASAATPSAVTLMTRNLYLGTDLFALLSARSLADVRRVAGEMLADLERRPFAARVEGVADEIAAAEPHVVGLQEAALVRVQRPSDFDGRGRRNATDVRADYLAMLRAALLERGLDYEVVASTVTTDVEVPADVDGDRVDVRLTDRVAVLARPDVEVENARTGTYEASLPLPVGEPPYPSLSRGYCLVDATVGDSEVTVANTHLESADAGLRADQAAELLALVEGADRPTALLGDFNAGPETGDDVYARLTTDFGDAYGALRPDDAGPTCCQPASLRNAESRLSRRVDHVLFREFRPTAVERVGVAPTERVAARVDGEEVRLWPSDHAGVVATLVPAPASERTPARTPTTTPTPTPTPTRTPTPTATSRDSPSSNPLSDVSLPGFGPVAAGLAVLVGAALARLRAD